MNALAAFTYGHRALYRPREEGDPDWAGPWCFHEDMWCKQGHLGCMSDGCWDQNPWEQGEFVTGGYEHTPVARSRIFIASTRFESHLTPGGFRRVIMRPGRKVVHEWWCWQVQDSFASEYYGSFCFKKEVVVVSDQWGLRHGLDYHGEDAGYRQCGHCCDCEVESRFNPLSWQAYRYSRAEEFIAKYAFPRGLLLGLFENPWNVRAKKSIL